MSKTATYSLIASTTLGSASNSVTLSSIPSTFTDLVLVINGSGTVYVNGLIRFNGDAGTNYSAVSLYANGTSVSTARYNTETFSYISDLTTTICTNIIHIQDYSNTTTHKTFMSRHSCATGGLGIFSGAWRNTSAITSIILYANGSTFTTGSTFKLYGIQAVN